MTLTKCTWCGTRLADTTEHKDHVFPRALGGTFEADLWVPSCRDCQTCISQAEWEVAHRSEFALYRYAKGVKPRHKERATSGLVEGELQLVKDPTAQRYSHFRLRCGEELPSICPAIEVDLDSGDVYLQGTPEDVRRLLSKLESELNEGPDDEGLVCDFSVKRLEELAPSVSADPDFNPRLYLSPRDDVMLCAREPEEAKRVVKAVLVLAKMGAVSHADPKRWKTWQIPGDTDHKVVFKYDRSMLPRVLLKISYGALSAWLRRQGREPVAIPRVQLAVVGKSDISDFRIERLEGYEELSQKLEDYLLVIARHVKETVQCLICLFGCWFTVDLASRRDLPGLPGFIGASCHVRVTGGRPKQKWVNPAQAEVLSGLHMEA